MSEFKTCCTLKNQCYIASNDASSGWYNNCLHGGVVAGMMYHGIEPYLPKNHTPKCFHVNLYKPVCTGPLTIAEKCLRSGKRIHCHEVTLNYQHNPVATGSMTTRPASLRLDTTMSTPYDDLMQWQQARPIESWHWKDRVFASTCVDIRLGFGDPLGMPGEAGVWLKLNRPFINEEGVNPIAMSIIASDFGNAVANIVSIDTHVFINPDLTIRWLRPPQESWVGIAAKTLQLTEQNALVQSYLYDQQGCFGLAFQSLILELREHFY
ncbi:MAG: acyl-CoA thioesterase domain-containing protein [Candidatus Comchoanobacterales bacterium]